uniref:EF-hand domain-containing protein n=1 Tax=Alexandrium catenella TaxID=2925 RepID=A0A7S1WFY0_ALECA|mmetsp:Transcript_58329/g.156065  ORF Transcript_58329/g.156065 Transcript_58329/m.156065 type:complete len:360 (+) Transcript_58329:54-1133(+)
MLLFKACTGNETEADEISVRKDEEPTVYKVSSSFDPSKSTEDNFSVEHFIGIHASIRPLMDYTYHRKYMDSRVLMQDDLIERFCKQCVRRGSEQLPWVVFTAGAMGAGKGYVTRWMDQSGYLPMKNFLVVDPDAIRHELPEWKIYCERDANSAGDLTQKEAGHIAEILGHRGLRDRYNVIFDGSLRDTAWYTTYFNRLRHDFPGIRIAIIHIVADSDEVLERAAERGRKTGRVVPVRLLIESMEQVPKSVNTLAPKADFAFRVVNRSGVEPYLEHIESATSPKKSLNLTWQLVRDLWKDIDENADGHLSREEVQQALEDGLLTKQVLDTVDLDKNGSISPVEFAQAREAARLSATIKYK